MGRGNETLDESCSGRIGVDVEGYVDGVKRLEFGGE